MKYILTIILFVSALFAQTDLEEHLEKLENNTGNERVDLLNKICEEYKNVSDNENAIKYAEQALSEASLYEYAQGKIDALNNLAGIYILAQQLEQGNEYARKADSLSEAINYKYGTATAYRNIGAYYIYSNKPQLAIDTLKLSVEMFEELDDTLGMASSLMSLGAAYSRINEIETGIELLEQAAEIFSKRQNDYQAAHAYLNLGSLYSTIMGDYQKGLDNSLEALEKFQAVKDNVKAAYAMVIIGNTYESLGNYEKPIEYYTEALSIFEKTGNAYLIANAFNNLGEVYKLRKEFSKAIEYYEQSFEKSKEISNEEGIAVALNNIGECYYELKNYNLAADYYNQSFKLLEELNDSHKMSISLNNQAAVLIKLNKFSEAISKAKRAISLAEEVFAKEEIKRGYENLYLSYKSAGNYKAALENYVQYEEIKDSLDREKSSEELARTLADYETLQKEKEIELLTKNAELKEAELKRQETLTYLLVIISIMLLVFAVVYYRRFVERKIMNKKLLQSEKELKELNKTKDLFFSIIAHDLRGPFNSLLGITELLAEDTSELSQDEIKHLSKEVNNNARNVYLLLENLLEWSSSQLGKHIFDPVKFDLNEVVTQNINLYRKAAELKEITVNANLANEAFVYADKNMIESVTRNLINNSIKFTNRNGAVEITTSKQNGSVLLSVSDNGIGIPENEIDNIFKLSSEVKKAGTENEKGTGLGLILSKEFIDKNKGKIEVTSKEGKETTFKVTLPSAN